MRLGLSVALGLALILPGVVSAQLAGTSDGVTGAAFNASVNPQYPTPYSKAVISVLSDSLDLANSTMAVSVAGKQIYKGSVQPVAVTLGKAGVVTLARVIITSNGASYSQTLLIQPQDLAIIAEPISSAPPLYLGKPLVPQEGDVRVVAAASFTDAAGKKLDPTSLSYSWTVDDTRIANSSGIGKAAIIVASPLQYRARDVSVVVTSQDGKVVSGTSLSLEPMDPSVRIYENDPLLGIRFDHALSSSYTIAGAESTLYAAPFSLPTTGGLPFIQWFLNGSSAQTGNSITLRPSGSGGGSASLSLTASAGTLTTAAANLSLIFGSATSNNFFGL